MYHSSAGNSPKQMLYTHVRVMFVVKSKKHYQPLKKDMFGLQHTLMDARTEEAPLLAEVTAPSNVTNG